MAEKQPKLERHDSTVDNLLLCPICHGQIVGASLTTCGHRFCTKCIREWLQTKQNCPTCRRDTRVSNLVEDKQFDELAELVNKKKMEQQQQQQQASGQDMNNSLFREMQRRDQVIENLTASLLEEKNKEIRRLEAAKQELTTTKERLKRENDGLKSQISDELPRLTESIRELQGKVDRKRAKKQLLKRQITEVENKLTATKTAWQASETQKKELKKGYDLKVGELQNSKKLLDGSREENKVLQIEIRTCKDSLTLLESVREKNEKEKAQLHGMIDQMFHQKQENDKDVETLRQQCVGFQQQVLQLQMFESMYWQTCQQMKELNENTLPLKDTTIIELQNQNANLFAELTDLRGNTILTDELERILESKLKNREQELWNYYVTEYGSKIESTERLKKALQNRVETLEAELKSRDEVEDELKKATGTYKSLVKENVDLKDEIDMKDKEVERLQKELTHSKARTYELEKKISFNKRLREDL